MPVQTRSITRFDQDMPYYREYKPFTIKGTTFQYIKKHYDDKPILWVVKNESNESGSRCGNPWNIVHTLDIRDEVISYMPEQDFLPDRKYKPKIITNFVDDSKIVETIKNIIEADCNSAILINKNRELLKKYYHVIDDDKGHCIDRDNENRTKLVDSMEEIIRDELQNDNILHITMNFWFLDITYQKIPTSSLYLETRVEYDRKMWEYYLPDSC